jgi:hypothetical protein
MRILLPGGAGFIGSQAFAAYQNVVAELPSRASFNAGIFERNLRLASSAKT